jgi:hypothetical protein
MAAGFKMCRGDRSKSSGANKTLRELVSKLSGELRFEITKHRFS